MDNPVELFKACFLLFAELVVDYEHVVRESGWHVGLPAISAEGVLVWSISIRNNDHTLFDVNPDEIAASHTTWSPCFGNPWLGILQQAVSTGFKMLRA